MTICFSKNLEINIREIIRERFLLLNKFFTIKQGFYYYLEQVLTNISLLLLFFWEHCFL